MLSWVGSRCCTRMNAMPLPSGRPRINRVHASSPPADAPTPTTVIGMCAKPPGTGGASRAAMCVVSGIDCSSKRGRSARRRSDVYQIWYGKSRSKDMTRPGEPTGPSLSSFRGCVEPCRHATVSKEVDLRMQPPPQSVSEIFWRYMLAFLDQEALPPDPQASLKTSDERGTRHDKGA